MIDELSLFLKKHIASFEKIISCERLSGGASQETYRLVVKTDEQELKLAFRRAIDSKRELSVVTATPGLAIEARLMQIARAHDVPEPHLLAVLTPQDQLGEGFVMEWLDGETLGKRILTSPALDEIRPQLAFQCGQILARIHAIDVEQAGLSDHLTRLTPRETLAQTVQAYQMFDTPRPMIDYTAMWLENHLPPEQPLTLIHNDFRNGNLIVASRGVVAVLDWELAAIGDPMCDLGWICANCWRFGFSAKPVGGFGAYEDLFRGYASVAGKQVDPARVKFWEVFASFRWAVICLSMAARWRADADQSMERAAIGRRASESEMDCVNLLIPGDIEPFEAGQKSQGLDLPEQAEMLIALRDHLQAEKEAAGQTRAGFMALVGANMLDIVLRETAMGVEHRRLEKESLEQILNQKSDLTALRRALIKRIREKKIPLDDQKLTFYLRQQTARQAMIDRPNYSGLMMALKNKGSKNKGDGDAVRKILE